MTRPGEAVLLVAHVLSALVSYGALFATGAYARAVRHASDPYGSKTLLAFFRPGHNLASRAIFIVPLLGGALVATGGHSTAAKAYPWIGLGLWLAAAGVAYYAIWPAERTVQGLLGASSSGGTRAVLDRSCRRIEVAAGCVALLFLGALVVMVSQP